MRRDTIKALYGRMLESRGGDRRAADNDFLSQIIPLIEAKKLTLRNVSFRALWEGLVGPCSETLQLGQRMTNNIGFQQVREDTGSSLFPKITGALIAAQVIAGYEQHPSIGDKLVTVMPSRLKTETIAGFTALDSLKEVGEGMPYEDSGIGEKFVTTTGTKRGRILSLTEEVIYFDQTGQISTRALRLGDRAALDRDKRIIQGACGTDPLVYQPAGVATTLYSDAAPAHGNLLGENALEDWTDVDALMQLIAAQSDEKNELIAVMPRIMLVPWSKAMTARRITTATEVRSQDDASATPNNTTLGANPLNGMGLEVVSSPYVDQFSAAVGDWYLGDFKRGLGYQEIWPIQTVMAREGHEDEFNRDIVFKYKVREFGSVFALDHRLLYKSQVAAV